MTFIFISLAFVGHQVHVLFDMSLTKFYVSDYSIKNVKEFAEKGLKVYDDSFNLFMGTSNRDLNWFDNPYVEMKVYDITNEWEP